MTPFGLLRDAATLVRSGAVRPGLPKPGYLGVALQGLVGRSPNLALQLAARAVADPRGIALIDDSGALTWSALDQRVSRLANVLTQAPPGPVGVLLRNSREFVEAHLAGNRAGRPALLLNTWFGAEELAGVVTSHSPGVLVADVEHQAALPSRVARVLVGQGGDYEARLAAASPRAPVGRQESRMVILTSGTTGTPRGARRSSSVQAIGQLTGFLERVPLRAGDRVLVAPPLFHAFGQLLLSTAMVVGATSILQRRFEPEATLAHAAAYDANVLGLVPVMLHRLALADRRIPDLKAVVLSGSPLSPPLREQAAERFGDVLYDLYGSTETGWVSIATPADHARKPGTVGRPGRGMTVVVADEDGRPLPAGQQGRVYVRTGGEFDGYTGGELKDRLGDATDTGDAGWIDADGYLFLAGRADDVVVTGGENVHPAEVEAVLDAHPGVVESTVAGVPDEEYGQVLAAFVVRRPGSRVKPETLRGFVRERAARYKVPRYVVFRDELPRNATGKVLRRVLAEEFTQ